jgi:Importin repeat
VPSPSQSPSLHPKEEGEQDTSNENDQKQTLHLSVLKFMLSLSEAKPSMVKQVLGWVEIMIQACLEAMGEFDKEEGSGVLVGGQYAFSIWKSLPSHLFLDHSPQMPVHWTQSLCLCYTNSL